MLRDFKRYPKHKPTSLSWVEEIPEQWKVLRGKWIFDTVDIRSKDGSEELLTVSSKRGVIPRKDIDVTMFKAESYIGYKLCWPEDLVINSLWAWAGGLGVSKYHGIISSAYGVYRVKDLSNFNPYYFHELVRSSPFQWELMVNSKGIWTSRLLLTDSAFLNIPFLVPPIREQNNIVDYINFLKHRTTKIINAKRQLIKLLEEEKVVLTHNIVTGAINLDEGSYDNYVECPIKNINLKPKHWAVERLRSYCKVINSNVDKNSNENEPPVQLCNYTDVYKNDLIDNELDFMKATAAEEEISKFKLNVGDVIITKDSEMWNDIGVPALVMETNPKLICGYHLAILRCNEKRILGSFLFRLLQDKFIATQLHTVATGVTRYGLSLTSIKDIKILIPPIEEQQKIVDYLNDKLKKIDLSISKAYKEIELYKEYQNSIIADLVTGKIDIKNIAKNLAGTEDTLYTDELEDLEEDQDLFEGDPIEEELDEGEL